MRAIVRAAAYVPAWTDRGRRVRGPDEDAFTMAATAIERVVPPEPGPISGWTVRIVGPLPAVDGPKLERLLGTPVDVREERPGLSGVGEAIAAALQGRGRELVVAVDLDPGLAGPVPPHQEVPSEGAVALRVDVTADGSRPPVDLGSLPPGPNVLPGLIARHRALGGAGAAWSGDWTCDPAAGRPFPESGTRAPDRPPARASEGAYVPIPRYLEGLPSRWRFVADRCSDCGSITFPTRGKCRNCGREDRLDPHPLPLDGGRVLAATWIGRGGQPTEFDSQVEASGPYGVVIADLEEGARATLPVADAGPGELRIGDPIGTRLRRLYPIDGEWRYGRKAVPLFPRSGRPTVAPS